MSSQGESSGWRVNSSRRADLRVLKSLWNSRDLIRFLALRDLRLRYRQAVLGAVWVLVQPVSSVIVFTLVFDRLGSVQSEGVPYPLFALLGMTVWLYFSSAVTRASDILVENPNLVTKVAFPRIAAPVAAVLPPLVDFAVSMVLVVILLLCYGVVPDWRLVAVPLWLLMLILAAVAVSLWLAALNVRFRDVKHAIGPLMQVWFFASPVVYSSSSLSGWKEIAYGLNPTTGIIELARWSILGAHWPGWLLLSSALSTLAVLAGGIAYFRRAERSFADVI